MGKIVELKKNSTGRNQEYSFEVILDMATKGDEKAFKVIYDMLAGKMYSLCMRYAGNTNDANDLFQEGCIRLYKSLPSFEGSGSFEGWGRKIFVNTCLSHLKNKQKLLFAEITEQTEMLASELQGIDKLSQDDLVKIIQKLPNGYRLVVNLYLVEGYSHKEISEMLGIAEGTSKSQLSRAKVLLQKGILERNV